jgi:integrase
MNPTERLNVRISPSVILAHRSKARAANHRRVLLDTEINGLSLTIGASVETYSVRVRPRGVNLEGKRFAPKDITIGDARSMTVEEARDRAREIKGQVRDGRDPTAERRDRKEQERSEQVAAIQAAEYRADQLALILGDKEAPPVKGAARRILDFTVLAAATLDDCMKAYLRHGASGGDRHRAETGMQIRLALSEMDAGAMRPGELAQSSIRQLVRHHETRPATAIARHGAMNRLYKWLLADGVVASNPVSPVEPPSPPNPRTDVMSAAKVQALWIGAEAMSAPRRDYLRLSLLLPLRRQELADVRRSYINQNGGRLEISLPATATKSGRAFTMPMQGEARAIVERLMKDGEKLPDDAYLIQMTREGTPMNAWKRFSEDVDKCCGVHLTLHGNRRTFASELGEHEIGDFALVDELLNHSGSASKPGAARHYFHGVKNEPRARIMGEWGRLIEHAVAHGKWPREMTERTNIVPLRRAE